MKEDIAHAHTPHTPRDPRDPLGLIAEIPAASAASAAPASVTVMPGLLSDEAPVLDGVSGEEISLIHYSGFYDGSAHHFLGYFWNQFLEDGSLAAMFPERNLNGQLCGFYSFVSMMSNPMASIKVIVRSNRHGDGPDDVLYPVGLAIGMHGRHGAVTVLNVSLMLLNDWWGRPAITEACRRVVAQWFTEGTQEKPWLSHLMSNVPAPDTRFISLLTSIGWERSGSIPDASMHDGKPCAAETWYYTRQMFNRQRAAAAFGEYKSVVTSIAGGN